MAPEWRRARNHASLRAGPALHNDIIFLLTDGEEEGMLGASAFVDEHPGPRCPVAANFEGRGNAGVSQLFETSVGNDISSSYSPRRCRTPRLILCL